MASRTFGFILPDGAIHRPTILGKFLGSSGLTIYRAAVELITTEQAVALYAGQEDLPYYDELIAYMTSKRIFHFVAEGVDVVAVWSAWVDEMREKYALDGTGAGPDGAERTPGPRTIAHGSVSDEAAATEIAIFFPDLEPLR